MILTTYRVRDFKSVTDSGEIRVDNEVTALVGKNESGKTACLEALFRLNPVPGSGHPETFDPLRDFPRARYAAEQNTVPNLIPIEATFELADDDIRAVAERVGPDVLTSSHLTARRNYANGHILVFDSDDVKAIPFFLTRHSIDPKLVEGADNLAAAADKLAETGGVAEEVLAELRDTNVRQAIYAVLFERLPKFFYFDEYSELPGRVSIPHLQRMAAAGTLDAGQATAQSLLHLAGVEDGAEFTRDVYEERKAALEAASSLISQEVFEFWSQNQNLRVDFDIDWPTDPEPEDDRQRPVLEVRIENLRHYITLNFSERSAGFQWFFSFLAAFSQFRNKEGIVLLLDEPALGLHATAQADLLRYIEERLAPDHQVLYTTHSPFLIDPTKLDRARTVEDRDDEGTKVESEILRTTPETVFPLQAALGYELAQTLFVAPDNMAVEGPSDLIYLQIASEQLNAAGREGLDPRWVIVPVGGADKLPTFIALLGVKLNVAVILDGAAGGSQKINKMIERGLVDAASVVPLAKVIGTSEADIEDMFDPDWYVALAKASGVPVTKSKLKAGTRIVARIEQAIGGKYDHYQPARHLLRNPDLAEQFDDATRDRFEALFKQLNGLLS